MSPQGERFEELEQKRGKGCEVVSNSFQLGNRPALDGLRGLSIIGVVGLHAHLFSNRSAFIGVEMFFVLSGFLITSILLQEWDSSNTYSLKRFYLRRVLRLIPALTLMLAIFVGYQWWFGPQASALDVTQDALRALLYFQNWKLALTPVFSPGLFGHTWTLSIEEQFYLLWPLALFFLLRRTASRVSLLCWVGLAVFMSAFARFMLLMAGTSVQRLTFGTDMRCDALLLGCGGAIALASGLIPGTIRVANVRRVLALTSVLGLLALTFWFPFEIETELTIVYFLVPLLALFLLMEAILAPTGFLCRALSQSWLVYVGKLSYGLYLWHSPVFLHVQSKHWGRSKELGVEFTVTAGVVLASYYLLEQPCLRLKEKFAARS